MASASAFFLYEVPKVLLLLTLETCAHGAQAVDDQLIGAMKTGQERFEWMVGR